MKKRLLVIIPAVLALALPAMALAAPGAPGKPAAAAGQTFVANLQPLNAGAHQDADGNTFNVPSASGTATIQVTGDVVRVNIAVQGLDPNTLHPQHIHAGPACPAPTTDPNEDTFLDVIEGLPAYGNILVNLDSDLSSNPAGTFPTSGADGSYVYDAKGSQKHLEAEIQMALALDTRHVVIHGIAERELPASVASLGTLPAYLTLPVACGELVPAN